VEYYHTSMDGKTLHTPTDIGAAFAKARLARTAIPAFPGDIPQTRSAAYAVQNAEIAARGSRIVGWKVAMTSPAFREAFGVERLVGPVFADRFINAHASGDAGAWAVIPDGFAAVEAEIIAVMAKDAPDFGRMPAVDEIAPLVSALHIGMELAGSPLATINDLGSFVATSDCGNNDGAVLGPAVADWQTRAPQALAARMIINGIEAGAGTGANVRGGPLEAIAFLVWQLEQNGRRLNQGDLVSTGAMTGIHKVSPGDVVTADFGSDGQLALQIS
jgi:2-keto-4-pentenoate hydratase